MVEKLRRRCLRAGGSEEESGRVVTHCSVVAVCMAVCVVERAWNDRELQQRLYLIAERVLRHLQE